jgi:hypothetical protein
MFVAKLRLEPDEAEVVTDHSIDVETCAEVDQVSVLDSQRRHVLVLKIKVHILDEHAAAFETRIKRVVPSDSRACHGRRCERHRNGQLAHICPLSHAFLGLNRGNTL